MKNDFSKRLRVYGDYRMWIANAINDSLDASILGADTDNRIGLFNMFHLLVQLRNEKYASTRPCHEDIACMREKIFCQGVDTRAMEEVFVASYNDTVCPAKEWTEGDYEPGDGGQPGMLDGIDYMQIEGDGIEHPKFRLK